MTQENHPLKELEYCPKCGNRSFEEQSPKSLICKECGFNLYLNSAASVVAILINDEGKLLFTVRKYPPSEGTLDLPGGFVDPGETAEEALRREVMEELQLNIQDFNYFGSFTNEYSYGGLTYATLDLAFICFPENYDQIIPGDDVADYVFIDLKDVDVEKIGLHSIRQIVRQLKINFHR